MMKIYATCMLCLLAVVLHAQTFYWVGPSGGNWNSAANWSSTSGGSGGAGVPNSTSHNVVFDRNSTVNVNLTSIALNTVTVTGSANAQLNATAGNTTITVHSSSAVSPALRIDAGSRLVDSAANSPTFIFEFANGARGVVNGEWYFTGNPDDLSTFLIPDLPGQGNRIDINNGGVIHFENYTIPFPNEVTGDEYLFFNAGSTFVSDRNGGPVTVASWDPASTIMITGMVDNSVNIEDPTSIGNLIVNSPNMSLDDAALNLNLRRNLQIQGDFDILSTNNKELVLMSNGSFGSTDVNVTVHGDFTIAGNSYVTLSDVDNGDKTILFQVNGDANIGGSAFDLQKNLNGSIEANSTTFAVKGDINHTAGVFTATADASNAAADLYIIELNGTTNQNISSHNGSFDNTNREVTLRLNNAAGATLLSPLTIGKINFNTANKGILTTTATNILTISNSGTGSLVVNSPSNAGHVNGPVIRNLEDAAPYLFPVGKGGVLRAPVVIPENSSPSVYRAEYFNSGYPDQSVAPPLTGVSNVEYWNITKISGANGAIELSLNGAVPGAQATDAVVVAIYNGADWQNASTNGVAIVPGNASSGTTRSNVLDPANFFTFGYGPQSALPVRLITFNARKTSSTSAEIHWRIAKGSNAKSFEVLKSLDGITFTVLGVVSASSMIEGYRLNDNSLAVGTSYYRLRMHDQDGVSTLSKIVAVINGGSKTLITSMMPTIVQSRSRINVSSSESGILRLVVTDIAGRMIHSQVAQIVAGNQEIWLNLQHLTPGAYQVTGWIDNQRTTTIRFIKQ